MRQPLANQEQRWRATYAFGILLPYAKACTSKTDAIALAEEQTAALTRTPGTYAPLSKRETRLCPTNARRRDLTLWFALAGYRGAKQWNSSVVYSTIPHKRVINALFPPPPPIQPPTPYSWRCVICTSASRFFIRGHVRYCVGYQLP